uniref:Uncharacterized protein n=1 Tax=Faecalibaculum rodentium TaxID=1702221 RepID=A0A140DW99_9FIRM|nr:hypothetical protein AALO17_17920 [Faecalibaculum rodentium]
MYNDFFTLFYPESSHCFPGLRFPFQCFSAGTVKKRPVPFSVPACGCMGPLCAKGGQ